MTTTTRAMNDASERVSNYLFHQFIINSLFGLVVAIALFAIGMKYSLLWGFLITLMRYVPYIGTWLGVIPPAIFAFATTPDFSLALGTVGIVLGLEMIVNNLVEPRIYGKSLGVSEVAQLVSAAIWSFLWGPIGLILSSPITTCLLVLGRHAEHADDADRVQAVHADRQADARAGGCAEDQPGARVHQLPMSVP